jgi:signal transduction histidine kinase
MMDRYPGMENTALFQVLKECMLLRITKNFDNEFTFPDQSKGWFELRIQPVPDGIFILSADITERRRLEEEKRAYMAGLETMIFMTSHRLRHPVSQILGISNLLDENVVSSEDVKKITAYMKESALSLDAFTSELTSFINHLKVKGKAVEESVIEY